MNIHIVNYYNYLKCEELLYRLDIPYFIHKYNYNFFINEDWAINNLLTYDIMGESEILELENSDYKLLNENQLKNLFWYLADRK